MSFDFHSVVQAGILGSFAVNGYFLRRVAKQIDRIEVLAIRVEVLTKALEHAEGTIKGAIKKVRILEKLIHEHANQVAKLQTDVDWIKEAK